MILPTKHISFDRCLLTIGAEAITALEDPRTITALWDAVRDRGGVTTFDQFCLSLGFLYSIGAIEMRDGLITLRP